MKKGLNKVKIFTYTLNVILIKAGYAKADKESEYQYKDIFIEYEKTTGKIVTDTN